MICPICERDCPSEIMEDHHLKTRRKDKDDTEYVCRECHKTIHGLFSNTDLRNEKLGLDTVEGLLANEQFAKAVKFIQTIPPGAYMKMRDSRSKRRHRRK